MYSYETIVTLLKTLTKRYRKRFRYIKSIEGTERIEIRKEGYVT